MFFVHYASTFTAAFVDLTIHVNFKILRTGIAYVISELLDNLRRRLAKLTKAERCIGNFFIKLAQKIAVGQYVANVHTCKPT